MISTGSGSLDAAMLGGLRNGFLTDVFGPPGAGKTQLCFSLCAKCALDGHTALFVDSVGTFRPERIAEIAGTDSVLEHVIFVRALSLADQYRVCKLVPEINPKLVVVDSLTALFSEMSGAARHLELMKHLHELAVLAVKGNYHIIGTNMVRAIVRADDQVQAERTSKVAEETREFLGNTLSLYSHMRLRLDIVDSSKSVFSATTLQPPGGKALFRVLPSGVQDVTE